MDNSVQAVIAKMSHGRREAAYQIALSDGDKRRADEIALATIPDDWPEHEQAVWRGRQETIRKLKARTR